MNENFMLSNENLLGKFHKIKNFLLFPEIDSTNEMAKRIYADLPVPSVIVSEYQSAGKGRRGRSFYSPKGTGMYFTVILNIKENLSDSILITSLAAVVTADAIRKLTDKKAMIKWVNDIYINDKKVCGILTELITDCENRPVRIIVGIGINFASVFPDDISEIAGNIGNDINRNELLAMICDNLAEKYDTIENRDFINKYRDYSNIIGKNITYTDKGITKHGKAVDINDSGHLVIENSSGHVTLSTGEITIRKE